MGAREFRFDGVSASGAPVQGTVLAPSRRAARRKVEALSKQHRFLPRDLSRRQTYRYKVRHPNGKTFRGEQKAFSGEELTRALRKMGLEVLQVEKKVLDLQGKPPRRDVILFTRLAANLLREQMPFDEVLGLLIHDVSSASLRQVIRDLNADLKGGVDAKQAFMKHQHLLGRFPAYMLGIASQSGNMAEVYEATARFLEREEEFRKSVRSAMITPLVTVVVLLAAFVWYIWFIFPQTARLFAGFGMTLPPLTAKTLAFAQWLDANYGWVALAMTLTGIGCVAFARTARGRLWLSRASLRVPLIGPILHKLHLEIFCRVFAILYSGSGDNLRIIQIAAEACGNVYMEHQIKTITVPMMRARGAELVQALEASGVMTPMALARFRSGAETGAVRESARQMADYYESETRLKLKTAVEVIQTGVAVLIAIAIIVLTLISSEVALIQPSSSDLMQGG